MNSVSEVVSSHMKSYDHTKINKVNSHMNHMKSVRKESEVDVIVDRLTTTFNNEKYRPLFRKAGWYLSESVIQNLIEASQKARIPIAYFASCIQKELKK